MTAKNANIKYKNKHTKNRYGHSRFPVHTHPHKPMHIGQGTHGINTVMLPHAAFPRVKCVPLQRGRHGVCVVMRGGRRRVESGSVLLAFTFALRCTLRIFRQWGFEEIHGHVRAYASCRPFIGVTHIQVCMYVGYYKFTSHCSDRWQHVLWSTVFFASSYFPCWQSTRAFASQCSAEKYC